MWFHHILKQHSLGFDAYDSSSLQVGFDDSYNSGVRPQPQDNVGEAGATIDDYFDQYDSILIVV